MSTVNILTAAEQRNECLATIQHSLDRACAFLQRYQERYKHGFYWHLWKGIELIKTGNVLFTDVSDGVMNTPNSGHADKAPFRILAQDLHTVVTQHKELVESFAAHSVALAIWPARIPPILSDSALAIKIQKRNLDGKSWMFHGILDHCLNGDCLESELSWGPSSEAGWEYYDNVLKEATSKNFARMRRTVPK